MQQNYSQIYIYIYIYMYMQQKHILYTKVSLSHIFQQGNALALALAKRARISFRIFAWMESIPPNLYDYYVVDFLAINLIKQTCLSSIKKKRKKKAYFVHLSFIKIKNYVGGIYFSRKGVLSIVKLRLVYQNVLDFSLLMLSVVPKIEKEMEG